MVKHWAHKFGHKYVYMMTAPSCSHSVNCGFTRRTENGGLPSTVLAFHDSLATPVFLSVNETGISNFSIASHHHRNHTLPLSTTISTAR